MACGCWEYQAVGVRVGGQWFSIDKEMGPLRGKFGMLDAELEVQRTIKRDESTAFSSLPGGILDPAKKRMKCSGPQAKDADLWILMWEEVLRVHQESILLEAENFKAHRSKRKKQRMSFFEKCH